MLVLIAATFLLAGLIKGVIGLGLPTVSIGLLAVTMSPARAIAIVIIPAILTNIWQTFAGPYLWDIVKRLWPLMLGTILGIWLNAGSLTGPYARYGTITIGVLLVIYAVVGLSKFTVTVARSQEKWVGGVVGLVTGVIFAATGVQVVPSTPFIQAIGMEKVVTTTPWHTGEVTFEGPPIAKLLDSVEAKGNSVRVVALNDYVVTIPIDDFARHGVILAMKRDGNYMPIRDKGPLFVIYPYDSNPELKQQMYYARSAWQVKRIEVIP